jgi:hypothetical protein
MTYALSVLGPYLKQFNNFLMFQVITQNLYIDKNKTLRLTPASYFYEHDMKVDIIYPSSTPYSSIARTVLIFNGFLVMICSFSNSPKNKLTVSLDDPIILAISC